MDGQMSEIPTDMQMTEPGDQRYRSLGGVYSGRVQPVRTGAQQADEFLRMALPDNGVNYYDIDFGFSDELPAVPSLFAPPDNGVS